MMFTTRRITAIAGTLMFTMSCIEARAVMIWGADSQHNVGGDSVVRFDSSNPAGTIATVGHTGVTGEFFSGLDFDRTGTLYAITQASGGASVPGHLYTIDQTNGHATLIGSLATPGNYQMTDLTYNPATDSLMGVAFSGSANYLYTISRTTGAATLVGQLNSPGSIFLGICADSSGTVYLEDYSGSRMRIVDGLNVVPMSSTIGAPVLFSQGMTMNWSDGGAWYLAATWELIPGSFTAAGDVRLMNNATGGTQQILGTWPQLPNNTYPIYAIGDIAIKPVPEPMGVAIFSSVVGMQLRRRPRLRPPSVNFQ
jgi:hypothetical protein